MSKHQLNCHTYCKFCEYEVYHDKNYNYNKSTVMNKKCIVYCKKCDKYIPHDHNTDNASESVRDNDNVKVICDKTTDCQNNNKCCDNKCCDKGDKGDKGDTGERGKRGPQGEKGEKRYWRNVNW